MIALFLNLKEGLNITLEMWKDIGKLIIFSFSIILNFLSTSLSLIFNFLFGYFIIKISFQFVIIVISFTIYWFWRAVLYLENKAEKLLSFNIIALTIALIKLEYHISNIYFKFPPIFTYSYSNTKKSVYDYLVQFSLKLKISKKEKLFGKITYPWNFIIVLATFLYLRK